MSGVSHPEGKDWSAQRYAGMKPATVLDVGPGQGIYAQMFRRLHDAHWTALEIHEPYARRYRLANLYDQVVIGDARTTLADHPADLTILGDVVEHMPFDEGARLLYQAVAQSKAVLLSIPLGEYLQGEIDGNTHEVHQATWEHADVRSVLGDCDHMIGDVVGVYWWSR